jgi:hypothetical protein
MKHQASYTYKLHCNATPRHWRDRLGQWLREWAELIDGRRTLAVDMDSDPPVPIEVQTDVLRKGLEHMTRLYKDAVADECAERLLKKALPHVFDAERRR